MADVVQVKKKITFLWEDNEHIVHVKITLPKEIVEKFFQGETLEFTFQKDYGRIDVKQGKRERKDVIIQ